MNIGACPFSRCLKIGVSFQDVCKIYPQAPPPAAPHGAAAPWDGGRFPNILNTDRNFPDILKMGRLQFSKCLQPFFLFFKISRFRPRCKFPPNHSIPSIFLTASHGRSIEICAHLTAAIVESFWIFFQFSGHIYLDDEKTSPWRGENN